MDIFSGISKFGDIPIYKQIVGAVTAQVKSGALPDGFLLPSMNELACDLDISRETVKKAYSILRDRGYVKPLQGKGFYISSPEESSNLKVLVIFDKFSAYKQIMFNEMAALLGQDVQVEIKLHNQSVDLLKYYLDESLDKYDYYVVTPHFPLDRKTQEKVLRQMKRIPNRKLIMLDKWIKELPGNYGAVYQDFSTDISDGLSQGLDDIRKSRRLKVITFPSSLYHECINSSVRTFCRENGIEVDFYTEVSGGIISRGDIFLLLNSQLDSGLLDLMKEARRKGLRVGKDFFIIYYNETPILELVLGGLTTVSADFAEMGRMAAGMILKRSMSKVKCPFRMTRRASF